MLNYKGYIGIVEFDDEADIFHGEVINVRDVITFQGKTVNEIRTSFKDSIEDYLEFCAQRNEDPEKPFSGKFNLRLDPDLHRNIAIEAKKNNISLNDYVINAIQNYAMSNASGISVHYTKGKTKSSTLFSSSKRNKEAK